MRAKALILILSTLAAKVTGQVNMHIHIADSIPTNSEFVFDVTISKTDGSNFAKYQIEVPEGVVLEEVDSRAGSFSYENKRAKIVWVIAPPDSEFVIKMKLISGPLTGMAEIKQKYYYIEDGNRKEKEAAPKKVKLYKNPIKVEKKPAPEPKPVVASKPVESKTITPSRKEEPPPQQQPPPASEEQNKLVTTSQKEEEVPKTPPQPVVIDDKENRSTETLKQQAIQFREDSKKAYDLGSKEKAEAEKSLNEANEMIKNAEQITDEAEKQSVLEKANLLKSKAEANNVTSEKILGLARSLEENAIELEVTLGMSTNSNQKPALETNKTTLQETDKSFSVTSDGKNEQTDYENKKINKLSQKETHELKQQAEQFRKDAKDASEIGMKEKEFANKKIQEADDMIENAKSIKDVEERNGVNSKAEALKQKAENDLQTAEKILILSKTLDDNANEIDKLLEYINTSTSTISSPTTENSPSNVENIQSKTVAKQENVTNTEAKSEPEEIAKTATTVYMLQIGAFNKSPDKSEFTKLGKYQIVKEENKFKVLVGSFQTRDEAAQKRTEILLMGIDCFIVVYQNGKRTK